MLDLDMFEPQNRPNFHHFLYFLVQEQAFLHDSKLNVGFLWHPHNMTLKSLFLTLETLNLIY